MSVKIVCINKDNGNHYNPYEAIEKFGWVKDSTQELGKTTLSGMIKFLENKGVAYVVNRYNSSDKAYLQVRIRDGRKFVQTVADGQWSDNLLQLPECTA
jgi:hypothetical protein